MQIVFKVCVELVNY